MHKSVFDFGPLLGMVVMFSLIGLFVLTLIKAIITRKGGWIAGAVISGLVSLGLVGAGVFVAAKAMRDAISGTETEFRRMSADDGSLTLEIPKSWKPHPGLNPESVLSASNPLKEQYVIVIREPRADFGGTLDEYARLIEGNMTKTLGDSGRPGFNNLTIGGHQARQRTMRGTAEKVNVAFLVTCLETEDSFCQILTWTLASREKASMPTLEKVAASFQAGPRAKSRPAEKQPATQPEP